MSKLPTDLEELTKTALGQKEHITGLIKLLRHTRRQMIAYRELCNSHGIAKEEYVASMQSMDEPELVFITQEQLDTAINAIQKTGHRPECKFSGCTCGQANAFIVARGEFIRAWQAFLPQSKRKS